MFSTKISVLLYLFLLLFLFPSFFIFLKRTEIEWGINSRLVLVYSMALSLLTKSKRNLKKEVN